MRGERDLGVCGAILHVCGRGAPRTRCHSRSQLPTDRQTGGEAIRRGLSGLSVCLSVCLSVYLRAARTYVRPADICVWACPPSIENRRAPSIAAWGALRLRLVLWRSGWGDVRGVSEIVTYLSVYLSIYLSIYLPCGRG